MAARRPLVLEDGVQAQLRPGDELDVPLEERFVALRRQFRELLRWTLDTFNDLPPGLADEAFQED